MDNKRADLIDKMVTCKIRHGDNVHVTRACVTGAAGFIGHHLCRFLKGKGFWVRAVDYKPPVHPVEADEVWWRGDLRSYANAVRALRGMDWVFALAADMGGMGFVGSGENDWRILHNNLLINQNTAAAADVLDGPHRILYTSSACVYPERLQLDADARELTESDAWRGIPDTAYGVEKLASERIYTRMGEAAAIDVRIARFHNIYGPECTWRGGREKAPAALCRKVAKAKLHGVRHINVWGDGEQTRSFCSIDDCLEMLFRLMQSDYDQPLNIGTDRAVSINELVDIIAGHAAIEIEKVHDLTKPQGVRGRNADLSLMREVLDYEPQVTLEEGIGRLYDWVEGEVRRA